MRINPLFLTILLPTAEGDQLVYEFCTPFLGGGLNFDMPEAANGIAPDPDQPPPYDPVQFLAPDFTPLTPLGNSSPVTIELTSGIIYRNTCVYWSVCSGGLCLRIPEWPAVERCSPGFSV